MRAGRKPAGRPASGEARARVSPGREGAGGTRRPAASLPPRASWAGPDPVLAVPGRAILVRAVPCRAGSFRAGSFRVKGGRGSTRRRGPGRPGRAGPVRVRRGRGSTRWRGPGRRRLGRRGGCRWRGCRRSQCTWDGGGDVVQSSGELVKSGKLVKSGNWSNQGSNQRRLRKLAGNGEAVRLAGRR
jgi:hypothetical protein